MRTGLVLAALATLTALLVTYTASARREAAPAAAKVGQASASKCGLGNGKKAKGRPIKLGGIFTLVPGIDFTTIGKIANAYFKCVNDNGGIQGRPISYKMYTEQLNPQQIGALARKLVQSDKVLGIVGNTSLIDCPVNHKYYESQKYYLIVAGVPGECFSTPNISAVNMGPRYSNIGAAQALLRAGAKSIIVDSPATIADYANGGPILVGKKAGVKTQSFGETLPITDPNSIILKLVQAAGPNGGVILDFTPESAAPLMKAAIQQGVVNRVKWGSSTPIANEASVAAVGTAFDNNKLYVNSEFVLITRKGPDQNLYRAITKKYIPSVPIQSFGQMGFMVGKFTTNALLSIKGAITKASVNKAILSLKNQKSDMLCKPWYYGKIPVHIPNNWDITVTYKNGKVVQKEKCFAIAAVDKDLQRVRALEKKLKLNTG